tara:strand:- start:309 stop:560 length:252 start_codon:yes stop_codon:yes gene_type:complete
MSSQKLTTARYLLKQVQTKRLRLLSLANYHYLTSNQLAEIKMCERAASELDNFLDQAPPELPNIAKFKKPKTEARFKINFKPH